MRLRSRHPARSGPVRLRTRPAIADLSMNIASAAGTPPGKGPEAPRQSPVTAGSGDEGAPQAAAAMAPDPAAAKVRRPRHGRPLAWHLVVLCLALFLPVLALAGVLAWSYAATER